MIWANAGMEDAVYNALAGVHPRMATYKKAEIPERYHYRAHRRIPPIVSVAEEGWSISWHDTFDANPDYYTGGTHGYDPDYPSMHGIFIAYGPAFRNGLTVAAFRNIHIYELICYILNLSPAQNDGSLDTVRSVLN
jgi:predicted AlkP superfamily pyrophosphatase or phosphodiesterase